MIDDELHIVLLHHNWKYLNDCCDILNNEWPRSRTARIHALESSNDNSPQSLVMLHVNNGNEKVVGHSKISRLSNYKNACFVEAGSKQYSQDHYYWLKTPNVSVVVHKDYRGRGWGSYLMNRTEEYAKKINMEVVYLSTKDKLEFYKKLGYEQCIPISIYGASPKNYDVKPVISDNLSKSQISSSVPPPPPIPPCSNSKINSTKVYLRKFL